MTEQEARELLSSIEDADYIGTFRIRTNGEFVYIDPIRLLEAQEIVTRAEVAQECYLQCLAVECGHGECCEAIDTKYKLENKHEE